MNAAYAIIAQQSQEAFSDIRFCDSRTGEPMRGVDAKQIESRLSAVGRSQTDLARALDLTPDKVNKTFKGIRRFTAQEVQRADRWLIALENDTGPRPDLPELTDDRAYLAVEVLPSFAGMGGGGTGDADFGTALVARRLIEDELGAKPSDVLLIDVRGDSMEPDFQHGDQILIDRRDTDPLQPGSFALWDGDGYVVKLVERVPQRRGWYRIFSANSRYSPYEVDAEEVKIMGRPVWLGRRL